LNANTKAWDNTLFDRLGLPLGIMGDIVFPGASIGALAASIMEETGARQAKVFAVGSHDTASALGAIPEAAKDWAFLSSGTWSLLGVATQDAILTDEALANDFTNEGGVGGNILFMRNITGLWLLQRLIAEWEEDEGRVQPYDELLSATMQSAPFKSIVNSDDSLLNNPPKMSGAIKNYCQKTNQQLPETKGELVRCVLESLAIKYYDVMDKLKACSGRTINKLYVVGGGSQNAILNQFTADALNMEVITGLTEATAIGNIMQQAIADQALKDWADAHAIIRNSFSFETFKPTGHQKWQSIIEKTKQLFQ
jgi:rhamnulokinase